MPVMGVSGWMGEGEQRGCVVNQRTPIAAWRPPCSSLMPQCSTCRSAAQRSTAHATTQAAPHMQHARACTSGCQVVESAGTDDERKYARRLIRICRRGNLLLCTLLLGNTVINSAISIILSSVTNGAVGLVVSTFVILLLGEAAG